MKIFINLFCAFSLFALPLIAQATSAQESQRIVFGVHSKTAPLEWRNNGVEQGFNLELIDRIGQLIGKRIAVRRKTFQQLLADVHNPKSLVDVIAVVSPVSIDRDLSQSDPIYATHAKAYTLQGKSFINGWHDLKGKRVAIKKGAFVDVYISGKLQNFNRVDVDLYETGFQLLIKGQVDVVIAENFVARRLMPLYPSIRSSSDPLIYGAFNFVSNHKNAILMSRINDALRQLKLSGEYDRLVNQWFGTGREKVDLNSAQQRMLSLAIFVSLTSALGMLLTGYISLNLRRRTKALNLELAQRKKAEAAIFNLSKQFQSVLDGIPHGVTLFNREGECLWSNDNNQLLSNPKFHYVDGQPFALYSTLIEALDTDKSTIADMMIENQYWQLQLHPIGDNQAVILLEETTEQQRLRQANDEASRLASLGELSAGIAHEINNPTGIIIHSIAFINDALADLSIAADSYQKQNPFWNIAGLEPTSAMEELNLSSQSIQEGAGRISRIVSDLKRYALPTLTDAYQAVSLNEVVLVSLRLTANQIKVLNVATQLHNPSPIIQGDAQQLNQVLINIIQNACHAIEINADTYDHDQHILIKTRVDGPLAYLTVIDKGQGMDRATLQRITEPFFTTRRSSGGSGLGLSVCSRIIKEHKADMQIESRIGQGTVITLRFPLEPQT